MAVINGITSAVQQSVLLTSWLALGNADTGTPDQLARYPYHSVQFTGTFGGATVVLEGSETNGTYFTLKDVLGNAVSATVAARFDLNNVPAHIRPRTSGGTGTAINCHLTSRSAGH